MKDMNKVASSEGLVLGTIRYIKLVYCEKLGSSLMTFCLTLLLPPPTPMHSHQTMSPAWVGQTVNVLLFGKYHLGHTEEVYTMYVICNILG